MRDVYIIGVGMTPFGKFLDSGMKQLAREAVENALEDAGVTSDELGLAAVGNSGWGAYAGQLAIRGQVVLRPLGIGGIPVINVENACACASTALHNAWLYVASGQCELALAVGMEKLYHPEKSRVMQSFIGGTDVEESMKMIAEALQSGQNPHTIFMDIYAREARRHMEKYGTTQRQLAAISSKNHNHSTLNPKAQYRKAFTVEEVLADREVAFPLTRAMCSPIGDGAAAAVVCSGDYVKGRDGSRPVKILASVLGSGMDRGEDGANICRRLALQAYELSGVTPGDVDVAEVHDATAYAELAASEHLGFCAYGEGGSLAESGATSLGGKIPLNPSGGLECKGHPVGATGLAQIAEIVWQLRGEAGERQVEGARIGLTQNGGGAIEPEEAAMAIHILAV
ncbi:MAG: thiolase family protein [Actinobacteria bacterium]|nr:thiolase family protein [Actinomycetota bacterium]